MAALHNAVLVWMENQQTKHSAWTVAEPDASNTEEKARTTEKSQANSTQEKGDVQLMGSKDCQYRLRGAWAWCIQFATCQANLCSGISHLNSVKYICWQRTVWLEKNMNWGTFLSLNATYVLLCVAASVLLSFNWPSVLSGLFGTRRTITGLISTGMIMCRASSGRRNHFDSTITIINANQSSCFSRKEHRPTSDHVPSELFKQVPS